MYEFRWNRWNVEHIGEHGVTCEEAEYVVTRARRPYPQWQGERQTWLVLGQTRDGCYLQVAYVVEDDDVIFVIHARPLRDHEKRRLRRRDAGKFSRAANRGIPMATRKAGDRPKPHSKMTTAQLRKATAYLDSDFAFEAFGPPSPQARKQLARAKRRGRPKVGKGAVRVLTTVEQGLLEKADRFRRAKGLTRAEMIGQGLKLVMARG
jgi:uncharacterized DUF497 family protein